MLELEVLPARHGDCLWIEYGAPQAPTRLLIDGGPAYAYDVLRKRIGVLPPQSRYIDLLIVTHIDGDHIEGIIRLLRDTALGLDIRQIWFNGIAQTAAAAPDAVPDYGVLQGEYLSALVKKLGIASNIPFEGAAVVAGMRVALPGGAQAYTLSPTATELARLRTQWNSELDKAGLEPDASEAEMARLKAIERLAPPRSFAPALGAAPDVRALANKPFEQDKAVANGSSIGILFEYDGHRILLLGDAFPEVIEHSVDTLLAQQGLTRLKADVVKLPHHGSRANISPALLDKLDCPRYVISSDGKYFRHPDAEAVARVIMQKCRPLQLLFNYRTVQTSIWDEQTLQNEFDFEAIYPEPGQAGLTLKIA